MQRVSETDAPALLRQGPREPAGMLASGTEFDASYMHALEAFVAAERAAGKPVRHWTT